jgi:hypothetical protein
MGKAPKVRKKLTDIMPPLSKDEKDILEQSILTEGCRDPVIVWHETGFIVDGHHKWEICVKHNIPYEVKRVKFSCFNEAMVFIADQQLGRRNLSEASRIELAIIKSEYLRQTALRNNEPFQMRKTISCVSGVGEKKVWQYMRIKEIAGPELLKKVKDNKISIGAAHRQMEVTTTKKFMFPAGLNMPILIKRAHKHTKSIFNLFVYLSGNAEASYNLGSNIKILKLVDKQITHADKLLKRREKTNDHSM